MYWEEVAVAVGRAPDKATASRGFGCVEQDKPFDPLNLRRNRPGTLVTGTHHPFYLVKEPRPGLILRILPVACYWEY